MSAAPLARIAARLREGATSSAILAGTEASP